MLCSEQSCVNDGQLLSGVYSNHVQRVLPFTTDSPGEEEHNDFILSEKESFINSLNNWYFGRAIFSRSFSPRYHIFKKKKKKAGMGWCRCGVENYYITPGDLSSQSELPNNF